MKRITAIFLVFSISLIPISSLSQRTKKNRTMSPKKRQKEVEKKEKKKEKEKRKAKKEAEKRHLGIQDKKVRRRLKRNKRKSNRKKK